MNQEWFPNWFSHVDELTPAQRKEVTAALSDQRSGEASLAAIELGADDERRCPHYGSGGAVSRGKARALRRFPCKACGKTFGALTGTPLSSLHHKERWLSFGEALANGETIRRLPSAAELRRARHSAGATACWRRFGKHRVALAASSKRTGLLCLRARTCGHCRVSSGRTSRYGTRCCRFLTVGERIGRSTCGAMKTNSTDIARVLDRFTGFDIRRDLFRLTGLQGSDVQDDVDYGGY